MKILLEWVKETNARFAIIIKKLLVYELKWHLNQFESYIVLVYQVKNLATQWATRDFQNLSDPDNPVLASLVKIYFKIVIA